MKLSDSPHSADMAVASSSTMACAFFGIVLVALLLRFWGIWNVSTTDEYNEVLEALRVGSGHLNLMRWGKRVYLYLLAVEYGIYFVIGWMMDVFQSPMHFAARIVRNMEPLFIMGRATSALCGTLTVGWLYLIGRRFFNPLTGLIAAALLSITVYHIDLCQQAKVDALLGLLVTGSLYFMLRIASSQGSRWDFAWCAILMALAIQTKINAVVLGVPLLFAWLHMWRDHGPMKAVRNIGMYYFPAFLLGFVIGNPPVLLAPYQYIQATLGFSRVYSVAVNLNPSSMIGFAAYPVFYYRAMGPGVCMLTAAALPFALFRINRYRAMMLAFILPFYFIMGASRFMVYPYYIIPALPFLYLLVGDMIASLWQRLASRTVWPAGRLKAIAFVLAIFVFVPPALSTMQHEISLVGPNTRYLAKEWIEANIPPGSKILMDSGKSINSAAPLIAENRTSLERILNRAKGNLDQGKFVNSMLDSNALIYYELLLETVPEKAYDITSTMFGLEVESVDYYLKNGFNYFVISESMKQARTSEFSRQQYPQAARFYNSLGNDSRLDLIQTIKTGRFNKGDTFLIYRLK